MGRETPVLRVQVCQYTAKERITVSLHPVCMSYCTIRKHSNYCCMFQYNIPYYVLNVWIMIQVYVGTWGALNIGSGSEWRESAFGKRPRPQQAKLSTMRESSPYPFLSRSPTRSKAEKTQLCHTVPHSQDWTFTSQKALQVHNANLPQIWCRLENNSNQLISQGCLCKSLGRHLCSPTPACPVQGVEASITSTHSIQGQFTC